ARLDAFGVAYIEGGFPGSNPKDIEFFERVGELGLKHAKIAAFGSVRHKDKAADEDPGLRSLVESGCEVLTIFGKSWDAHVTRALRATLDENLRMVEDSIAYLKAHAPIVFFDAEHFFDGYKSNPEYALAVCQAALDGGADALVLCETNGGALPYEVATITATVIERFPGVEIGIHAHNDGGCAVANSLEAIRVGATQVQGTINGYGERVGNADLIVIIPALELKMGLHAIGSEHLATLTSISLYVAETLNVATNPHHPYVGSSAFAHKGGIHVSAIARFPEAYEHINPELVGNLAKVVVSELAGRASLVSKAAELGVDLSDDPALTAHILEDVKERENEGYSYEVADGSLALLLHAHLADRVDHFKLESFRVIAEKREDGRVMTEATIKVHVGGKRFIATGEGNGPVNALDVALRQAITVFYPEIEAIELTDYKVRVLDESIGTNAVTRVLIESTDGKDSWGTIGVSENIIEASWTALVDSIEYGLSHLKKTTHRA
ncbi:MAG: citramalate synthase, partial [Actinobacteria bacterium]|nr:citramalate synthase [Actinomycetota bacterium]